MSIDAPTTPDDYRAIHERDLGIYRDVLDDLRHTLKGGLEGIETLAQTLARIVPMAEETQRNLRLQGDSINTHLRQHDEPAVDTPDCLAALLDSLSDRERRVYDEARLGATQAARALGRHAQP
ncbi:hypothetical protein [Streptomyces sp. NBC_00271]|uniref:hypothetical protein n=1 Tax=Streptomyces sp. NBC_00271 TaxID=2975697 RepID=UPI002E2BD3A9|nr:hypothetical protein [Streptomyces sp. NBC_00271]